MDTLIITDHQGNDIAATDTYDADIAFGSGENDFEITVPGHDLTGGQCLYFDGTEYGGIIDESEYDTKTETTKYKGRTWHGILVNKIIRPMPGQDYYTASGELHAVLRDIIRELGLGDTFKVDTTPTDCIVNHQFNRYQNAYEGILSLMEEAKRVLVISRGRGGLTLTTKPQATISNVVDSDLVDLNISRVFRPPNHLVCLGAGELKDRQVIDLYADKSGNISKMQTYTGLNEIELKYDFANSEDLEKDGIKKLKELQSQGGVKLDFYGKSADLRIGDKVFAREVKTGTTVTSTITKKIVKGRNGFLKVSYEIGNDRISVKPSTDDIASSIAATADQLGNRIDRSVSDMQGALDAKSAELHTELDSYKAELDKVPATITAEIDRNNGAIRSEIGKAIGDIQVGGRNLLMQTSSDWIDVTDGHHRFPLAPGVEKTVKHGDEFTISYEMKRKGIKSTGRYGFEISIGTDWNDYADIASSWHTSTEQTDGMRTVSHKTANDSFTGNRIVCHPYFHVQGVEFEEGGYIMVRNVKLERGTKATDWTPAPEDIEDAYATKTSLEQTATEIKATAHDELISHGVEVRDAAVKIASDEIASSIKAYSDKADATFATVSSMKQTADAIKSAVASSYATKESLSDTNVAVAKNTDAANAAKAMADTAKSIADQATKTANDANSAAIRNSDELTKYQQAVTGELEKLQGQVDAQIETWFEDGVPTTGNKPANEWTTDQLKANHEGDLYFDRKTGKSYRWLNDEGWKWQLLEDTDVSKALAQAAKAQDTADGKRRVFVAQPKPPYDVGDLWSDGKDLYRCLVARPSGAFTQSDWQKATDYTNDEAVTRLADHVERDYRTAAQQDITDRQIRQSVEDKYSQATKYTDGVVSLETQERKSQIQQLADSITSTVEKTYVKNVDYSQAMDGMKADIDGIQVGGRNLLLGTSQPIGAKSEDEIAENPYQATSVKLAVPLEDGRAYTISGHVDWFHGAQAQGKIQIRLMNWKESWKTSVDMDLLIEEGKDFAFTIPYTSGKPYSSYEIVMVYWGTDGMSQGNTLRISNLKLERGTKATDWTPAPEDVQAGIDQAKQSADTATATAKTADDAAKAASGTATAAKQTADQAQAKAAQAEQAVTTVKSEIKQNADSITALTKKTTEINGTATNAEAYARMAFDGLKLRVSKDQLASEISMTSDRIHIKSGKFGWEATNSMMEDDGCLTIQGMGTQRWIKLTQGEMRVYRDNNHIGSVGGNVFEGTDKRGLVFDLESDGTYMAWASRPYAGASGYTIKMIYTRSSFGGYSANAINFGCDVDFMNNSIYRPQFRIDGMHGADVDGYIYLPTNSSMTNWAKVIVRHGVILNPNG